MPFLPSFTPIPTFSAALPKAIAPTYPSVAQGPIVQAGDGVPALQLLGEHGGGAVSVPRPLLPRLW
jgi:hypothetical protein